MDSNEDIMGTEFYLARAKGRVYLGVVIAPFGCLTRDFDEADFIDWLRKQLAESSETKVPAIWEEAIGNGL